ncbi:MAG: UDP-N-acetylglucosamine diphosphorylase/glucosamine-1-phosphate N-acetyltransferase [Gammaproteobacteria bacterium CG22_combo_CG10-13_8_21_14_all_40_8]|nr:MAG: UDP-N-acetylglucosamine diphosphorylase/glucosamine-1-phosphate N-acetyltransferase [Gammaproteobacteria bacterium CG22_combo_CG10-13_8_21_14_all_40_8]
MKQNQSISAIILAAGKGTRMCSDLPKVLHPIAGKPMLHHVLDSSLKLAKELHVVYGHGAEQVKKETTEYHCHWHFQKEQLGTAHAVSQAIDAVDESSIALILYGDVPLIRSETLIELVDLVGEESIGLLSVVLDDPTGYGRIVRDDKDVVCAIVEQKDADATTLKINEVNTGIMALPALQLNQWLKQISNKNAQNEYYLTDIIDIAVKNGFIVKTLIAKDTFEVEGVNNRQQQARLERHQQMRLANELMRKGVTILDPARIDIRGTLECGRDVVIDVNVVFEGNCILGDGVYIGPNCVIHQSQIDAGSKIQANCVIDQSKLGKMTTIGPFARLRPGTQLDEAVHVGNFVEIKKSHLGEGTKVGHLSYLGDATIGKDVNVGAGTITCNYDGVNKHQTIIEDRVFVGSDTQLVAPVTIHQDVTIGAGTTVTADVEANSLVISRVKQRQIAHWVKPKKN